MPLPLFLWYPLVACREEMREITADVWCTDESSWGTLPTRTTVTIQPNTDTIWMEIANHSSQWAELIEVWLVITPEPWSLTFALTVRRF